jgi:ketosteroid isomerase-like protein
MCDHDIEANKRIARRFIDAINRRSLSDVDALMHADFVWITAVVADDEPNELRPLQSSRLRGTHLPHPKPRLNRAETITFFAGFLGERSGAALEAVGKDERSAGEHAGDDHGHMHVSILGMTAEDDRVAVEARSTGIANPQNGKQYANFYHLLLKMKDGRIILYKEYQDTLHVYDYTMD